MQNDELCLQRGQVPQGRAKTAAGKIGDYQYVSAGQELNYAEESKEIGGGSPIIPEPRKVQSTAPEHVEEDGDII